ncbi:hypothetical protein HYW55_06720 [Candidatus Gottesmanbacteria bacterium]|nr:hypothetical protein [Candidatus Gottesmanbacteria bacterium]
MSNSPKTTNDWLDPNASPVIHAVVLLLFAVAVYLWALPTLLRIPNPAAFWVTCGLLFVATLWVLRNYLSTHPIIVLLTFVLIVVAFALLQTAILVFNLANFAIVIGLIILVHGVGVRYQLRGSWY